MAESLLEDWAYDDKIVKNVPEDSDDERKNDSETEFTDDSDDDNIESEFFRTKFSMFNEYGDISRNNRF
jgi:hypothetical protein